MEYTFRFYKNDKHMTTKTFDTSTIEDAYKKADNVLRQNKSYDDWDCLPPKTNDGIVGNNEGKKGTQRSPFGIGS